MKIFILLIAITISFSTSVYGQKMKLNQEVRVHIATKADENFPVLFRTGWDIIRNKINVMYNAPGDTLSYQL
ncbi:MAG TPA: hypothetical protein VF181_10315 [Balneolaceae bacterium]